MEIPKPTEWEGREVDTLDVLLFLKRELDKGRPLWLFTGYSTAESLISFVQGLELSSAYNSRSVERYQKFVSWLRDEKEFPGEGWAAYYLRQHGGDHHAAVMRFLGYVAEFATR